MSYTHADYLHLIQQILEHDRRYYVENKPSLGDTEYDQLRRQLETLEQEHPEWVLPDSPTQRVGHVPLSAFTKVTRAVPMLSLDNTYNEAELHDFFERVHRQLAQVQVQAEVAYVLEPKIDGISVELTYAQGRFVLATTRGDGLTGEDITANLRTMGSLPLRLQEPVSIIVRGEVYMERQAFAALNQEREEAGEVPFKNPRNAAGGTLKQLDARIVAQRPLRLLCYDLQRENTPVHLTTHAQALQWLNHLGFPTPPIVAHTAAWQEIHDAIAAFDKKRHDLPYETDGLVLKVDRFDLRPLLGMTARSPRWAIAYKYAPNRARTVVRSIEINVGRTGVVTPVALLDPVTLSGTVVARASLHNWDQIQRLDLHTGDAVLVEKAGEIIPQIVQVVQQEPTHTRIPIVAPTHCPACHTPLLRYAEEVALRCPNTTGCPAQLQQALAFFCHRHAMNIEHLGDKLATQLIQAGLIHDLADVYTLTAEALAPLQRLGPKSIDNLLQAIETSKRTATLRRFLTALGIPSIGSVWAQKLASIAQTLHTLRHMTPEELTHQLMRVAGFGPERIQAVVTYLNEPAHQALLDKFLRLGVDPHEPVRHNGPLSGKLICISGTLSVSRSEAKQRIEAAGGTLVNTVTKKTHSLVLGEEPGTDKQRAAMKAGIPLWTEADLWHHTAPPQ